MTRRLTTLFTLVLGLLLIAGCAKSPDTGGTALGRQLNVTVSMAGIIDPNLYYYVVFNNVNDPSASGPIPVIAPPWGNGFVAGAATGYMSFHGNQGQDGYQFYTFVPGSLLQQSTAAGAPTQDTPITNGSTTLQFRIPLSYLATTTVSAGAINYVQVNIIATNYVPVNPQDTTPKDFDALGDPRTNHLNSDITISTATANTVINPAGMSDPNYEPLGDVQITNGSGGYSTLSDQSPIANDTTATVASLDIVGYSIQVLD